MGIRTYRALVRTDNGTAGMFHHIIYSPNKVGLDDKSTASLSGQPQNAYCTVYTLWLVFPSLFNIAVILEKG